MRSRRQFCAPQRSFDCGHRVRTRNLQLPLYSKFFRYDSISQSISLSGVNWSVNLVQHNATVSRTLNDPGQAKPDTLETVLLAISELRKSSELQPGDLALGRSSLSSRNVQNRRPTALPKSTVTCHHQAISHSALGVCPLQHK